MDIIIPISKHTTELKYAIRSFEKYIPHANIYLYDKGDKPGLHNKEANIFNKIMQAVNDDRVSEDFIYANDDHFILPGFDVTKYYYAMWPTNANEYYRQTIKNSYSPLRYEYYDIHCPCIFNKEKFINSVGKLDWTKPYGYCLKTLYCHMNNIIGNGHTDLKLQNPVNKKQILNLIKDRSFFSTSTPVNKHIIEVLEKIYP
jgi:hypothetical protein